MLFVRAICKMPRAFPLHFADLLGRPGMPTSDMKSGSRNELAPLPSAKSSRKGMVVHPLLNFTCLMCWLPLKLQPSPTLASQMLRFPAQGCSTTLEDFAVVVGKVEVADAVVVQLARLAIDQSAQVVLVR